MSLVLLHLEDVCRRQAQELATGPCGRERLLDQATVLWLGSSFLERIVVPYEEDYAVTVLAARAALQEAIAVLGFVSRQREEMPGDALQRWIQRANSYLAEALALIHKAICAEPLCPQQAQAILEPTAVTIAR